MSEFKKPSLDDWAVRAVEELKGRKIDELEWPTPEGIEVKALYTAEDLETIEHHEPTGRNDRNGGERKV